jgi:nucleoside-diphosphate-sugar epimerase
MAFHRFCRALLRREEITVFGDGRQSRDFTYVDDAVEANVLAWRRPGAQGVYNVGGGSQVEVLEAIRILEGALGVPARVSFEARALGDPLRTRAENRRLKEDFGVVPRVAIAEGLPREAEWARSLYAGAPE